MPSYSFTRTVPQIVAKVLRKLGALGIDETPGAEDTAVVREAIDLRLKELHSLGVLWFNVSPATTDLALTSGAATKSLSAVTDFLFAVTVKLRISGEDRGVEIVSHDQYQAIENKAETGEPSKVYFGNGTAYFWPTPDQDYTAKLTYQAIAEDTASTGATELPVSMLNAFTRLVAGDLLDEYEVSESKAARLIAQAKDAEKTIRTLNSPRVDSTTVEMESL